MHNWPTPKRASPHTVPKRAGLHAAPKRAGLHAAPKRASPHAAPNRAGLHAAPKRASQHRPKQHRHQWGGNWWSSQAPDRGPRTSTRPPSRTDKTPEAPGAANPLVTPRVPLSAPASLAFGPCELRFQAHPGHPLG